jgi:hypothetical protein
MPLTHGAISRRARVKMTASERPYDCRMIVAGNAIATKREECLS